MRTARNLEQEMYYSLKGEEVSVYETDDDGNVIYYTDEDGNKIPLETGETKVVYKDPIEFSASIAFSGGDAQEREYGLTTAQYDATLICQPDSYPIKEGTIIWYGSEPKYDDDGDVDQTSADYIVVKFSKTLGVDKYILSALTK